MLCLHCEPEVLVRQFRWHPRRDSKYPLGRAISTHVAKTIALCCGDPQSNLERVIWALISVQVKLVFSNEVISFQEAKTVVSVAGNKIKTNSVRLTPMPKLFAHVSSGHVGAQNSWWSTPRQPVFLPNPGFVGSCFTLDDHIDLEP